MCRGASQRAPGRIAEPSRRRRLLPEAVPQEAIVLLPRLAEEEARAERWACLSELGLRTRAPILGRGGAPGEDPARPAERAW